MRSFEDWATRPIYHDLSHNNSKLGRLETASAGCGLQAARTRFCQRKRDYRRRKDGNGTELKDGKMEGWKDHASAPALDVSVPTQPMIQSILLSHYTLR